MRRRFYPLLSKQTPTLSLPLTVPKYQKQRAHVCRARARARATSASAVAARAAVGVASVVVIVSLLGKTTQMKWERRVHTVVRVHLCSLCVGKKEGEGWRVRATTARKALATKRRKMREASPQARPSTRRPPPHNDAPSRLDSFSTSVSVGWCTPTATA